jgi:ABC-type protease/lipase transport system fused ATPase/permease subunit
VNERSTGQPWVRPWSRASSSAVASRRSSFRAFGIERVAVLSVEDLAVHYRTDRGIAEAVRGATFDVPEGQVMGVVGESGCGKTTLARAIIGVMLGSATIAGGRIIFRAGRCPRRPGDPWAL